MLDNNSIGESKFKQEKNYIRMMEGDRARTLESIQGSAAGAGAPVDTGQSVVCG